MFPRLSKKIPQWFGKHWIDQEFLLQFTSRTLKPNGQSRDTDHIYRWPEASLGLWHCDSFLVSKHHLQPRNVYMFLYVSISHMIYMNEDTLKIFPIFSSKIFLWLRRYSYWGAMHLFDSLIFNYYHWDIFWLKNHKHLSIIWFHSPSC